MWTVLDLGESAAMEDPGPLDPNSWATSRRENKPQDLTQTDTGKTGNDGGYFKLVGIQ